MTNAKFLTVALALLGLAAAFIGCDRPATNPTTSPPDGSTSALADSTFEELSRTVAAIDRAGRGVRLFIK